VIHPNEIPWARLETRFTTSASDFEYSNLCSAPEASWAALQACSGLGDQQRRFRRTSGLCHTADSDTRSTMQSNEVEWSHGSSRGHLPSQWHRFISGILPAEFSWGCTRFSNAIRVSYRVLQNMLLDQIHLQSSLMFQAVSPSLELSSRLSVPSFPLFCHCCRCLPL